MTAEGGRSGGSDLLHSKQLRPFVLAGLLASCAVAVAARAGETAAPQTVEGPAVQAEEEKGWELLESSDEPGEAYELWGRIPPGSKWRAFRLIGDVDAPPAVAVELAMDVVADPSRAGPRETRRLLLRSLDVVVSYSRVDLPLAADRDVTTHLEREYDAERGEYRLVWHEANDEGPPLEAGVVRMQRARGQWVFQPLAGGRSHSVFESYADLGGSLPAWLINPLTNRTIRANLIDLRAEIARRRSAGARRSPGSIWSTLVSDESLRAGTPMGHRKERRFQASGVAPASP